MNIIHFSVTRTDINMIHFAAPSTDINIIRFAATRTRFFALWVKGLVRLLGRGYFSLLQFLTEITWMCRAGAWTCFSNRNYVDVPWGSLDMFF